jgi:hypothetical protein
MTPELPKNVFLEHTLYPASLSPLSTVLLSNFFNTMSPIEEEIENNIDDNGWDKEIEIDDETRETDIYNRPRDRKYNYMRRKFQIVIDALLSVE